MRKLTFPLLALISLAACTQQQTEQAQQTASAAVGAATQALGDASAPLGDLKQHASAVLGEAKQKVEQAGQDNPLLGAAVTIIKEAAGHGEEAAGWQQLEKQVGKYPTETSLYSKGMVAERLRALLGDKLSVFNANMQVSSPLQKDGVYYASGNKPHESGSEMAYLLLDPGSKEMEVGLVENGKLTVYRDGKTEIARPQDIRNMLSNLQGG